jgi:7,8-dihydropterin-6-yl-methyl-4-(beta-D-ribofuranosyl)aminobenzene 5'-phosphate synthase
LYHAQKLTGVEHIHAVIGGTHLHVPIGGTTTTSTISTERLDRTIAELKRLGIQRIGPSHCTGPLASIRLAQEFGDAFFFNNAGTRVTIP